MPELAEVEYFRKQWECGIGQRIARIALNGGKRTFRDAGPERIAQVLRGAMLLGSETRGKQMAFRFSKNAWLGVHLGMTGKLHAAVADFTPGKHDHLVIFQRRRALVFSDPRMFGRIRFHEGKDAPRWWSDMPPAVLSREFTVARLREILRRRTRAPLKALLLMQEFFPGVGNWMADEILWQARLHPRALAGSLGEKPARELWKTARAICRTALKTIGEDWSDPPERWLIHHRWTKSGRCPRHRTALCHATIGGRTTAWCPRCQPAPSVP